jgi:hypothetical protein
VGADAPMPPIVLVSVGWANAITRDAMASMRRASSSHSLMRTRCTADSFSSFTNASELNSTVRGWRRLKKCRNSGTATAAIARSAKGLRNDTGRDRWARATTRLGPAATAHLGPAFHRLFT